MENSKKTWKIDGYVWLYCPVCGHEVMDFDICDVCGWQNTGVNNVDGGPNHMTLEKAKKSYADSSKTRRKWMFSVFEVLYKC